MKRLAWLIACALTVWVMSVLPAHAQTVNVTDDDVNRLANRLYCPVCPNETLDACRTEACAQWRGEIRQQLQAGATEQQVVDNFVARFGERVIGSPQDPVLRALALIAPILIAVGGVLIGIRTFARWGRARAEAESQPMPIIAPAEDEYRRRLEQDVM